jgi:hypothetical protein
MIDHSESSKDTFAQAELSGVLLESVEEILAEHMEERDLSEALNRARQLAGSAMPDRTQQDQLKQRLLKLSEVAQPRRMPMRFASFKKMSSFMKLSAAALAAAILIGTGWAAEQIYERFIVVTLESPPPKVRKLPNGKTISVGRMVGTKIDSEDPAALETAKRHHEEMKQFITEKKYKFLKTFQDINGNTQYIYQFQYADGTKGGMNFPFPLEDVASWEEAERKQDEMAEKQLDRMEREANDPDIIKRHQEEMGQIIAEKKYKFLNTFQDSNGTTQYIYSFTFSDGSSEGRNFPFPLETVASWEEVQQKLDNFKNDATGGSPHSAIPTD